jgi:hypothetical protein
MLALGLLTAPVAGAQQLPADLLAARSVGQAHSMLLRAAPCFRQADAERELWDMLGASLARIAQRPDLQQAYDRGMTDAQNQQRYIARADPHACAQIAAALRHFVQRHAG